MKEYIEELIQDYTAKSEAVKAIKGEMSPENWGFKLEVYRKMIKDLRDLKELATPTPNKSSDFISPTEYKYDTEDEESDIETVMIEFPTLDEMVYMSETYVDSATSKVDLPEETKRVLINTYRAGLDKAYMDVLNQIRLIDE